MRLLLILFAAGALMACGSVSRTGGPPPPSESYVPPGAPTPDPEGPGFLTVVLQARADPIAVSQRVTGPTATVQQAPQVPQENLPHAILRRTYRINLMKGQASEALRKARADSAVMRAYLGEYPDQYSDPPLLSGAS